LAALTTNYFAITLLILLKLLAQPQYWYVTD